MYLKRLEMQGFKSFADKTVLEFMPGITTVIGPNGSGKSNISDSIRWVLGEQSMKSLRGTKSEDIIFAGTQNRKSLGFAEASMVIDNTDGKLPIEYSEVTVTRRIYRSGESGYFINKTPCRLKDILELFMDTGIGKDGYSIIGQGKIDEILSNKSEDRRHIFEEAAGIVKYRVRKAESEKKLEQTKLNLLRINDILSEIEVNLEPLKIQSEKAKKFLNLREELKNIEVGLFLYNIDNYKKKISEVLEETEIYNEQINGEEEKFVKLQSEKENAKNVIDELINKIEEMQNIGFESEKKKEQYNSEINVCKERIKNNSENFNMYEVQINEANEKIKELEEEKSEKILKKDRLTKNRETFQKELEEKEAELKKLSNKLSEKEIEIEEKKKKIEQNTDYKYELIAELNKEEVNVESSKLNEKNLKIEVTNTISELDKNRIEKEDILKTFREIDNKRNSLKKSIEDIEEKRNESTEKIKRYEETINNLYSELRMKESRYNFLVETEREKEGYQRSVKSLLLAAEKDNNLIKGMHGVIANLLKVPKEYEVAIEMCLGMAMQNIVTDTENDAKKLIEYLRNNNLGRASFLPISAVKAKKLEKFKRVDNVIGIASDLVKYDKKYEQIMQSLLGRTVIVNDMEAAIALSKKNDYTFRIVTVEGDIINPTGAMTGGSIAQKTINILGRAREIEELSKQIEKLKEKIKNTEIEKNKYRESVEDTLDSAFGLEKELQEIEIVYATESQKVELLEKTVLKLEEKLEKVRQNLNENEESRKEALENQSKLKEQITEIENENEKLLVIVNEFKELNKDNQKYIDDLNFDITNLKISVSSFDESQTSVDEMVERIENDIKQYQKSIDNKHSLKEKVMQDNNELENKIDEIEQLIEKLKLDVTNSSSKIEQLKQERTEKNEQLTNIENELENKQKQIDDLKAQVSKAEVRKSKAEVELEQIINKMWEEYELTPNSVEGYQKATNVQSVQKQVNELRFQIKELGSINVDSIKEYQELSQRYDFMCEQRLDLETASNKLKKIISEMTEIMKKQFADKFKVINKNFSEVFTELFGGGKAELILENKDDILECGIEIAVQPPGKKLQNMMLLSGGEKAFTAIALLFAILKINPAPFCVLDEIEAALDDVNVYRFAEYLKKFTKHTQFLVITHRKGTMEAADTVYGITMEEKGISKLLSMKLK